MARRIGSVWGGKGVGWISKREEQDAQYENLGEGWPLFLAICRFWPDFLADILWSDDAEFDLAMIQRMFLRINARYRDVDITGCRGVTKSFCTDLGEYLDDLTWPGITGGIFGPSQKQTAAIAKKIFAQIENNAPMLTKMLIVERQGEDTFVVTTPYGSRTSIEAFRGNTMHKVVAEETAQEDKQGTFDADSFKESVLPQVRAKYRVRRQTSPAYISYKQHSITSAGRRQQYAYETRRRHRIKMMRGDSAFVIDVPVEVVLLCQIRDVEWVEKQKDEIGLAGVPRELGSIYSGNEKNPIIRDEILTEARCLLMMEEHHCCKDRDNRLKPQDVIYLVCYDVSYRDAKGNAKCACVVLKLTKQDDFYHRDKYLKQQVWVEDWTPAETPTPMAQAQRLRRVWKRYCFEGSQTYIVIDAWQYGDGVLTSLMADPQDGGVPLCVYRHLEYTELELEGAIPVIYPIKAGGNGVRDPDSEMVLNAELQFEHGNVQLLTGNMNDGVEAYKSYHRIKDDDHNYRISQPYKKTNEQVEQIKNLREEPSGQGIKEKRISRYIQRDSWSALKYGLRFAQLLERSNLAKKTIKSDWDKLLKQFQKGSAQALPTYGGGRMVAGRQGGRRFH